MLNFLIAPDFPPEDFAGWHLFNTNLQRATDTTIRLLMPADHREQTESLDNSKVGLIYANPFDASQLVRERGYLPLVRPIGRPDEMVIASYKDSAYRHSDDLKKGCRILVTSNQDVIMLGLRLLESAGLAEKDIEWLHADTFQEAARRLIEKEADAAFFLKDAYHNFRSSTLGYLKILMESRINDLSHVVLLHPDYAEYQDILQEAFTGVISTSAGKVILEDLNIPQGFEILTQEDVEFLIDVIDTLRD